MNLITTNIEFNEYMDMFLKQEDSVTVKTCDDHLQVYPYIESYIENRTEKIHLYKINYERYNDKSVSEKLLQSIWQDTNKDKVKHTLKNLIAVQGEDKIRKAIRRITNSETLENAFVQYALDSNTSHDQIWDRFFNATNKYTEWKKIKQPRTISPSTDATKIINTLFYTHQQNNEKIIFYVNGINDLIEGNKTHSANHYIHNIIQYNPKGLILFYNVQSDVYVDEKHKWDNEHLILSDEISDILDVELRIDDLILYPTHQQDIQDVY